VPIFGNIFDPRGIISWNVCLGQAFQSGLALAEAAFLVVSDPPMNEL
jgi:hypothetical protein